VNHLVEVPRQPDAPAARSDAELVVDVALGVLGASVGAGLAVVRATAVSPVVRSAAGWRAPFVPARLQPAELLADLARRGAWHRVRALQGVERLLDQWTPVVAELVVSRLDLTGIVTRHVDIDDVVKVVDLDAVVARIDLDAIVQRIDLDAAVAGVDLDAAVGGVDIDAIAGRLDLDAVIERIDIVAMVEEVIAAIDLPAIIRDSTGSMASETVRTARMTGISADEAISRGIERYLFRRRRSPTTTDAP
jgi:PAS domain-containing protein